MISFHREVNLSMIVTEALSLRRGFLFRLRAGFTSNNGQVDKDSGMLVPLPDVDSWLQELTLMLESKPFKASRWQTGDTYSDILKKSRNFLQAKAVSAGAKLTSLSFHEERNWGFSWELHSEDRCLDIYYSQYVEMVSADPSCRLLKLELHWKRISDCDAELSKESRALLNGLKANSMDNLILALAALKDRELKSGSWLSKVLIYSPRDSFVVEV